jgi:polyisoprenoid-binding protein YceI
MGDPFERTARHWVSVATRRRAGSSYVALETGLETVRYVFDKSVSRFTVQAFATGMLSLFGHNPTIGIRDFGGEAQFVPGSYDKASVRLTVKTATFEVLDEMKRDDREKLEHTMYEDVLDIEHFPSAVYESKQIIVRKISDDLLQASVTGALTLRGATQSHSFDARVMVMGTMLRISGDFTLRQSDYGIKPVSFAGGALRLKDELKINFQMVAKQEE